MKEITKEVNLINLQDNKRNEVFAVIGGGKSFCNKLQTLNNYLASRKEIKK